MDVRLSLEQQALRDATAQVVDRRGPRTVGQLDDLERREKLEAAVDASGWRELRAAAEGGAPLASGVECAIVAEELGRGLADAPFLGPVLASELRRLAGAPASGTVETVALTEDLSAMAVAVPGAPASAVAVTGAPASAVVVDAQGSTHALVLVASSGGHHLGRVALSGAPTGVDLTRPSRSLDPASPAEPLGPSDRFLTADDRSRWTALGLSLTCADLVGAMSGAVQLACAYAAERRQYGAAIGSFQAVQHLLADAFVATEGARSVTRHAAWAVDALDAQDALGAAAVAKAYCARAAREVCETAIQVHGGIGNTWECLAHVYLRRALLSTDILGDAGVNLTRVLAHRGIGGIDGLR